jgi:hypothetical protein
MMGPVKLVNRVTAPPVYRSNMVQSAQLKPSGQGTVRQAAPPVYRPQAAQSAQLKLTSQGTVRQAAPPVYRPQAAQSAQLKLTSQGTVRQAAPPVYRPQAMVPVQRAVSAKQSAGIARGGAPPVYRPNARPVQRAVAGCGAPPVYRPQPTPQQRTAIQAKIDLAITAHGLQISRGADLKRFIGDFKFTGGTTYRHMSNKSLRLEAAAVVLKETISGSKETSELLTKAANALEKLETRAESWERYTEDRKDQFVGSAARNSKLNSAGNLYDSLVFEALATTGAANPEHYQSEIVALARHYVYKRIAAGQRAALLTEMESNGAGVLTNVANDMNGHIDETGKALEMPTSTISSVKATLAANLTTFKEPVLGVMMNLLKSADDLLAKGVWYGNSNIDGEDYVAHLPKVNQFAGF